MKGPNGPPFLPEALAEIEVTCDQCGRGVRPNFWQEFEEPFTPIYPDGTSGEKGSWRQTDAIVDCSCGGKATISLDPTRLGHGVFFFGDEADRSIDPWSFHFYTLIGGTSGVINEISHAVLDIKARYVPDLNPDEWRIHATEMLNARKRITHRAYRQFDRSKLLSFFEECAGILKKRENMTWNSHIFAGVEQPDTRKGRKLVTQELRRTCHLMLLSSQIYRACAQSLRPMFTLERTKPTLKSNHREAWSWEPFLGSKNYLAYAFLTRSNEISPPKFAEPGSHACLELADLHAYFAGQALHRHYMGAEPDIELKRFGRFQYMFGRGAEKFLCETTDHPPANWLTSLTNRGQQ
jgi:hypothetical protein